MKESLCLNCSTPLTGKFCHVCGQKKIEDKERKLTYFIYQFFGAAFFLENNFIKNVWYLLIKPGFLAAEYVEGRRKKYMAPFSLFLLINLFYFIVVPLTDLNLSLKEQLFQPQHKFFAKKMIENRLKKRDVSLEEYGLEYNDQSTSLSKTLIILHAPFLAFALMGLFWKKKIYFTDHLIFSLYFIGFILLISILSFLLFRLLINIGLMEIQMTFTVSGFLFITAIPLYLFLALKKFYRQDWWILVLKTPLCLIGFIISHFIYRTLLFLVVFWTT